MARQPIEWNSPRPIATECALSVKRYKAANMNATLDGLLFVERENIKAWNDSGFCWSNVRAGLIGAWNSAAMM